MNDTEIIFIEVLDPDHPEQYISDTVARFERRGYEVRLISPTDTQTNIGLKDIVLRPGRKRRKK